MAIQQEKFNKSCLIKINPKKAYETVELMGVGKGDATSNDAIYKMFHEMPNNPSLHNSYKWRPPVW